jgi:hypothetical protein
VREGVREGAGLAVHNGVIATSAPWKNRIYFFDCRKRTALGEVSLPRPKGMLFDDKGRLLVLTGKDLRRYAVEMGADGKQPKLANEGTLITGLEDPQRMTSAPDGKLYLSD